MKKLVILFCLFFITTFSHAQDWSRVYSMNFIKYVNGEWIDDKSSQPNNVFVMLKGSEVIVKGDEINRYMTYGKMESTTYSSHVAHSWKCLDKDGDDCLFIMKRFNDGTIIYMIVYRYFGVEFYVK